jgi:hypothetical protein
MKIFAAFMLVLFIFSSCQQTKLVNEKDANVIVGKWRIYETVNFQNNDDSVDTKCNTCPEVEFAKNHTGYIKTTDTGLRYFRWQTDETGLTLNHDDSTPDTIINNGNYKITFMENIPIKEVQLTDSVRNIKYVLTK